MRSSPNRALGLALLLVAALVATVFFWRPVAVNARSAMAECWFRREFSLSNKKGLRIIMAPHDWVLEFGGRTGAARLRTLAEDPSLCESGRALAQECLDMVESGGHLPCLKDEIDGRMPGPRWPYSSMHEYVYRKDARP